MLKYLSKFVLEILPSVVATIIGAYIVNHYIAPKSAADAPVAASVSTATPKAADAKPHDTKSAETKSADAKPVDIKPADVKAAKADAKATETSSDIAAVPDPGTIRKIPIDRVSDKPAETASVPAEGRRHQPLTRDKTAAKPAPAPVSGQGATVAAVTSVPTLSPVEASPTQDRDANDIARAAIERLRNSGEAPRTPEPVRVVPTPSLQPLPPPIMVSTPSADALNPNGSTLKPPAVPLARVDDPRRPTPPADIPPDPRSRPLDLHAEAAAPTPERTTVAEDMLSAAKSVFHSVLPR